MPWSVAPEILLELQIRVESPIFDLRLDHFFDFFISLNLRLGHSTYFHGNISQGVLMNKPDNSDGSRGQLTARTDTCHLLQIQSP
jgi:hypothetical protein